MKYFALLFLLLLSVRFLAGFRHEPETAALDPQLTFVRSELDLLLHKLDEMAQAGSLSSAQVLYLRSRRHFKRIEFFLEYIFPVDSKYLINGPLVPKFDEYGAGGKIEPAGFQVIEQSLFADSSESYRAEAAKLAQTLKRDASLLYENQLPAARYLEMQQLEVIRIASLTLNGYDATIRKNMVEEAVFCLEGLHDFLDTYQPVEKRAKSARNLLSSRISSAIAFCKNNGNSDTFDRLTFVRSFLVPVYGGLIDFHHCSGLPWNSELQAVNLREKNPFSREGLNVNFFAHYSANNANIAAQAQLGKVLFFDPILSGKHDRACAACHIPEKYFADGRQFSKAAGEKDLLHRNTPTLMNALFQRAFFWDGRARRPEQQIDQVVHSKEEMEGNLLVASAKLRQSSVYRSLFASAFGFGSDDQISPYYINKALVEYEKTLTGMNSRFDRYLQGEDSALTAEEKWGYNLFAGKAQCGSCHFFPLFNGTVPPSFSDSEFEILGVPSTKANNTLDRDTGRSAVTHAGFQQYAFKTPTVRNVSGTAPYMHNGIYDNLEEVMNFYVKGGGRGLGYAVPNQTLPFDSLRLTLPEQQAIIRFMKALEDETISVSPFPLPEFELKPEWNNRIWGGRY